MRLAGKVALVTGAGSGIGKAAALLMAKEGANIAALDRDMDELRQAVREIAQLALFLASDASSHITGTPVWIDGAESLLMG